MVKFKAKNDTFYRGSYISKGDVINGGVELYQSVNFDPVDGKKPEPMPAENHQAEAQPAKLSYKELCLLAKELKIENFSRMPYPALAQKVAEAQAKAAEPADEEKDGDSENNQETVGGDSADNPDNTEDLTGEDEAIAAVTA